MNAPLSSPGRSSRQLLLATAVAVVVAALLLICVVLPAEYGIDPLRTGQLLGLGPLAEAKRCAGRECPDRRQLHACPSAPASLGADRDQRETARRTRIQGEARGGEPMLYSWTTQGGGRVYYEFHGEPTEGDWPTGYFRSYETVQSSDLPTALSSRRSQACTVGIGATWAMNR